MRNLFTTLQQITHNKTTESVLKTAAIIGLLTIVVYVVGLLLVVGSVVLAAIGAFLTQWQVSLLLAVLVYFLVKEVRL